ENFLRAGNALGDFQQSAATEFEHPVFDCFLFNFPAGSGLRDEAANIAIDGQDLEQSRTSDVARPIAVLAAAWTKDCLAFVGLQQRTDRLERLRRLAHVVLD